MATDDLKTPQRENHTRMTQRPGALAFAAEGTPLNAAPAERAMQAPKGRLHAVAANARAAANQAPQTPPPGSCRQCPTLSFFFDGTGNNLDADVGTMQHSNIARLFQSRLEDDVTLNRQSFYVPGLGTYFSVINDPGHTKFGLGMGAMGQDRLDWAFKKFDEAIKSAEARAQNPTNKIIRINVNVFGFSRGATAARAFVRDLAQRCDRTDAGGYRLKKGGHPIEVLFLGLFDTVASVGLPMSANNTPGATTAGWYSEKTTVDVRATTSAAPISEIAFGEPGADPAPGDFNGHARWADGLQVPAPGLVKRCVHMIAGHEIRNSFPCDSTLDGRSYPSGVTEMVYPGAHSDVGGGYQPGEGARSAHYGEMLSLIPLRAMHSVAREAGVPLIPLEELARRSEILKRSFALDDEGSKRFNDMARLMNRYMQIAGSGGRDIGKEMLAHSSWYLRWHFFNIRRNERAKGQGPDEQTVAQREPGFAAERKRRSADVAQLAATSEQADVQAESAQADLNQRRMVQARYGIPIPAEVTARAAETGGKRDAAKDAYLRAKAQLDTYADDSKLVANMKVLDRRLLDDARAIQEQLVRNPKLKLRPHYRNLMDAYTAQYLHNEPLDGDLVAFFDRYVHDSLAGFATDATLPSDPRVVYAGGDNKIRYAALDRPDVDEPRAA